MAILNGSGFVVTELGLIDSLVGALTPRGDGVRQAFSSRCTITATAKSQVFQWYGSGHPGFDFDGQGAANQMAFDYGRQNAGI